MRPLESRKNLALAERDRWMPVSFDPLATRRARAKAALRGFFDVQVASIRGDLAQILPHAKGTVVDVGCGVQPWRPLLPAGVRYVGIDSVATKAHFGYDFPGTIYFEGDRWPLADGEADLVLCTETLEHVLDTSAFLAEMRRCLAPGGKAVLTVPFASRWHFVPQDFWRFTPSSLKHLLERAGLANVRVYARGNHTTVACSKAMVVVLRMLMPDARSFVLRAFWRFLGVLCLPAFFVLALVARASLLAEGGDDCLGYTVLAERPA